MTDREFWIAIFQQALDANVRGWLKPKEGVEVDEACARTADLALYRLRVAFGNDEEKG